MNWTKHSEKLNGLYKGNTGFKAVVVGAALLVAVLIGLSRFNQSINQAELSGCIDGLFNGEYTDTACETCEKLINRK